MNSSNRSLLAIVLLVMPIAGSLAAAGGSAYSIVEAGTDKVVAAGTVRFDASAEPVVSVSQKNKAFAPTAATITVGQSIQIVNDDDAVHNVFCHSGDFKYNSGPQQPGASAVITFTSAGTFEVRCAIHPKMKLTVTVAK